MAKDGTKMSKSLGNGIDGNEALNDYGADASRYYLLTKAAPELKLNFDIEELGQTFGYFNTLDNLSKYMNSYLSEHEAKSHPLNLNTLDVEDKWILYRSNRTVQTYFQCFESYKINEALIALEEFIVRDLSKTYLKLVKDRTEERDENLLALFDTILKKSLIMLGAAIPFKAEQLYQATNLTNKKESVFLEYLPETDKLLIKQVEEKGIDKNFDLAQDLIQATLNAREKVKIGLRWPLGKIDLISTEELQHKLEPFEKLVKKLTNIHKISYGADDLNMDYVIKPNFQTLKTDFQNPSEAIKAINMSKFYIANDLKSGETVGTYEGVELDLTKHVIKEIELKGDLISSDFASGSVILHTAQDEILLEEGYLRELTRRVQQLRKEVDLDKKDQIKISFAGSDKDLLDIISNAENLIKRKVGATDILEKSLAHKIEHKIKDKLLVVSLEK